MALSYELRWEAETEGMGLGGPRHPGHLLARYYEGKIVYYVQNQNMDSTQAIIKYSRDEYEN
jgi:hypothetical protein